MAKIKFTSALSRFFPGLGEMEIAGRNVKDVVSAVEQKYPGIQDYLLEEDGSLRQHVNIFVKEELINDREKLSDQVNDSDEILIYQALSGG